MKKIMVQIARLICILTIILPLISMADLQERPLPDNPAIPFSSQNGSIGNVMINPGDNNSPYITDNSAITTQSEEMGRKLSDLKVEASGVLSYLFVKKWGGEGKGDGKFNHSYDLALDNNGNVYVADTYNHRIQKFNNNGNFITKWGEEGSGDGNFSYQRGIAVDNAGNIFVSDGNQNRIQKFSSDGTFLKKWGESGTDDGQFNWNRGVAVDSSGNVYVADNRNHRIQKFTNDGAFIKKWGSQGTADGEFNNPVGIAVDGSGYVYVADYENHRIQKFTSDGTFITKWGSKGTANGQFNKPFGVAVDNLNNVFISDYENDRIQKFKSDGTFITKFGSRGISDGQFIAPGGIAVDDDGNVFLTEISFSRIHKYKPSVSVGPPIITEISPATSSNTASKAVVINGKNFRTGALVNLTNSSISIYGTITSLKDTSLSCTFPLTGAPTKIYNISVYNTDGTNATLPAAFTVTNSSPVITAVTPATGFNTTNTNLTITGSSFRNGITAKLVCDNFTFDGTNLIKTDTTKVQYTFATLGQPAGKYNLTLTNIDGSTVTKPSSFELKSPSNSPVITATNPWTGANNAAKPVIITGSNFRGPTSKTFTGITVTLSNTTLATTITGSPTSKKTQSATTLYYTLPLTGQPAGIYDLIVRNYDGSTVTNTSGFIITTTSPTVTKVSPVSGYTTKDQPVTLTGSNYRTGASVVMSNGSISYNGSGVTVASPTTLTCTLGLLTDSVQPGGYNLTVTNTDGTSGTLANAFTVIAPVNSPIISSITPEYGANNIALPVTIRGSNFSKQVVTITNGTASFAATATKNKKQSATVLYYTLPLKGLESGDYQVKVTNADGTYATVPFAVNPTTPTITAISPVLGYTTGNTAVTITGTNYRDGATVVLANGSDSYPAEDTVVTVSKITCTVPTTGMSARKYNLTVTNTDGTNATKPDFFTVYNPGNNPMIEGISPNVSSNAESKAVTIYGADFRGTKANSFDGIAVTLSNVTTSTTVTGTPTPKKAHSATRLYYTLPFSGVPAGVYDLKVVNADGQVATMSEAFTVTTTNPTIAIDSKTKKEKISPVTAFNTGTVSVTITGNNFREGVAVRLANGTEEIEGTVTNRLINQVIPVFPLNGREAGSYNLTITNTDGTSVTAKTKFTVVNPGTAAVISSVSPASAFNTGNQPVVISGKNFNKPTVYLNQGELTLLAIATAKKKSTATTLYVTFPLKDIPGGLYSVIVRNSDGVNTTATDIFYVTEKAWVNSVHTSPVVQSNPRMPVMSLPQVSRPAGNQAKIVGPQMINSPVVVPAGPVVGRG